MKITREQAQAELARRAALVKQNAPLPLPESSYTRKAAILAKNAGVGALTAIPNTLSFAMNSPTYLANLAGYVSGNKGLKNLEAPAPYFNEGLNQLIDEATGGYFQPQTFGEKVAGTIGEFTGGGAGLAKAAATKISPFAQKYLAPQVAKEYAALAGAGAGLEAGKELAPDSAVVPVLGALGGTFAPSTLTSIGKTLASPIQSLAKGTSISPQKYQAFKEAGLTPTLGDITDSRFIQGVQNIAKELPLAENQFNKAFADTAAEIGKYGEGLTQRQAGELAQTGLRNWQTKGQEVAGRLQQKMSSYIQPAENIKISNTLEAIANKPKFSTPEALAQYKQSAVGKEYSKLANIAARNEGAIPYEDLVYFRQQIDDQISNFGLMGLNKEQGALKNLRTQIQKDVGESFKSKGDEAYKSFERHNKFYTKFAEKNEKVVNQLLKNKTATKAFRSIISDSKVDARNAQAVLNALPNDQKQLFSKSLIRELGMSPQNEFNASNLATNFKKLEPESQNIVLSSFNNADKKQFRATIDAIDSIKQSKSISNPSGTFNQGLKGGLVASAITSPIKTGASIIAANVSAKLMTSPRFVKWLGEASLKTDPKSVTESIGKLAQIAKIQPELIPDLQQYISSLNRSISTEQMNEEVPAPEVQLLEEPILEQQMPQITREDAIRELERRKMQQPLPQQQSQYQNIQPEVNNVIRSSANSAGLNPEFVYKVAKVESGLNPNAKNRNSSASGLFQFTNGTWKEMIKRYGNQEGISLRDKNNPFANAKMAGLYLRDNAKQLGGALGRNPTQGEVYASHVLGLGGATKMLKNYGKNIVAASLFPVEARANRNIFYKRGRPVTIEELYQFFDNKMMA